MNSASISTANCRASAILDKGQQSVKGMNSGSEGFVTVDLILTVQKPEQGDPKRPVASRSSYSRAGRATTFSQARWFHRGAQFMRIRMAVLSERSIWGGRFDGGKRATRSRLASGFANSSELGLGTD